VSKRAIAGAPFELVVFDVDGTLHDTFRWWGPVLRQGLSLFAAALDRPLELPDDDAAGLVVGLKDEGVWGAFLPPDLKDRWRELREIVVPLEVAEVHARDHLFAGTKELLAGLRGAGLRTALASNCRSRYLAAVAAGQGLLPLTDWQFCLDSPGIEDKTGMVRAALHAAGTQRAVMVGDREPDREAADALGLPFVWRTNPRCDLAAGSWCWDGRTESFYELLALPG